MDLTMLKTIPIPIELKIKNILIGLEGVQEKLKFSGIGNSR